MQAPTTTDDRPLGAGLRAHLLRIATLAGLWWMLTGADPASWLIGGPVILGILAWQRTRPSAIAGHVRLFGLVVFVPFFLWRSFLGGCDVAWRTLQPGLPIQPALRRYPLRLPPEGPARVLLANTINLLPGTATAEFETDALQVHMLTDTPDAYAGVVRLEERVAAVFGHKLPPAETMSGGSG